MEYNLENEKQKISTLYPVTPWNLLIIIRWFTIIGIVSTGLGIYLLIKDRISTFIILETLFTLLTILFFVLGYWLGSKNKYAQDSCSIAIVCMSYNYRIKLYTGSSFLNWFRQLACSGRYKYTDLFPTFIRSQQ